MSGLGRIAGHFLFGCLIALSPNAKNGVFSKQKDYHNYLKHNRPPIQLKIENFYEIYDSKRGQMMSKQIEIIDFIDKI